MKERNTQEEVLLEKIYFERKKETVIEQKGSRKKIPNLKAISAAYDDYFIYNKLKLYCKFLSYSQVTNDKIFNQQKGDFAFIDILLFHLDKHIIENPSIKVYNKIRQLYELPSDASDESIFSIINSIRGLIQKKSKNLCDTDITEMNDFLINFCIGQLNLKKDNYAQLFVLCNNDNLNLLFIKSTREKVTLNPAVLKNTVEAAYRIEEDNFFRNIKTNGLKPKNKSAGFEDANEWVEKLIGCYKDYLEVEHLNYKEYCIAFLKFKQNHFIESYEILKKLGKPKGAFINVAQRTLYLKVIYEIHLTESDILEKDSVDVYNITTKLKGLISESKKWIQPLSSHHIIMYKRFIRYYINLFKIFNLGQEFRGKRSLKYQRGLQKLKEELNENGCASKSWLLEKIKEL